MGRRILAFFLGFIFAFVCIAGAIAIVVFAIKLDQVAPVTDDYLGDLAHMSLYEMGQSLYKLYLDKKTFKDETTGKYYSLGDFCENYNIDLKASLGIDLPQEVLDIPAFEFFNEGGLDNAMKQIKVSTLPAIANMFGGTNEDGTSNAMFGESVMTELSQYSMFDLLSNEEVGFAGVFANIRFVEILPDAFPAEDSDNKLMWAVGQTKIGGLLSGMSGGDSFMLQLKTGGAFETLGQLELASVFGDSQYISAVVGSKAVFADLIADDGSIRLDDIINGISVGELLGCQKNGITQLDGYAAIEGQDDQAERQVMQKIVGEEENAITLYVMSANKGEHWYEAELKCSNAEEGHSHNADCFKFIWYSTTECNSKHTHENSDDMLKDGTYYARTEGLYAILAALSITDLTSGNTDALMNEIKTVKIGEIIDAGEVHGIMETFVDLTIEELMNGAIDEMYLGGFFNLKRDIIQNINEYNTENILTVYKERDDQTLAYYVITDDNSNVALSYDKKDWYAGNFDCDKADEENHVHHENCYSYVWRNKDTDEIAEGVQNKLASKQIADLQYINDEVQNMTLADVFGKENVPDMLKSIAEVKIGELNTAVNTIQLGTLLEYTGKLTCGETEEGHVHDHSCYEWTDKNGERVEGMMAKLAYKTVGEMSDLTETIKTFTLRDVLGDDIPDMLKSLADAEIGNLNTAIKNMRLGDFLEYEKRYTCGNEDEGHEHNDETCDYAWYRLNCNSDEENHQHDEACYVEVEGMMAKIANKKVDDLGDMDSIVQDLTLRDVLGENIPAMLLDVADTKVSEIGDAIQDIYLGSALGYARKEVTDRSEYNDEIMGSAAQGKLPSVWKIRGSDKYIKSDNSVTWYEATMTCKLKNNASHTHNTDCYPFVWYEDEACETPVSGIVKAFVNCKVGNVSDKMEKVTLGEMGIGKGNNILEALQDTPVVEIGDAINDLKMAVVMGYTRGEKVSENPVCGNVESDHKHNENCYDYIWYEDAEKTKVVKGLNLKVANKTVSEMTGDSLTDIALGLTIGELIDTGMISLGDTVTAQEENTYKLAIIYCGNGNAHTFTENTTIGGITAPKTWKCNLADYLSYSATKNGTVTAKQYWLKCHGVENTSDLSDEDIAHRDTWKDLTLKVFISSLLSAI